MYLESSSSLTELSLDQTSTIAFLIPALAIGRLNSCAVQRNSNASRTSLVDLDPSSWDTVGMQPDISRVKDRASYTENKTHVSVQGSFGEDW